MRKTLFLISILFSTSVFGYRVKGIVGSGVSSGRSNNYKLTGVVGIAGYELGGFLRPMVEEQNISKQKIEFYVYNYPNLTRYGIWIEYGIPKDSDVSLKVYDIAGREIRTLILGRQKFGRYRVYWDGIDNNGKRVGAGIYFYRMKAGEFKATRKLTILR